MNQTLFSYSLDELQDLMKEWGYPAYRAKQIHEWLHAKQAQTYESMSNLPKKLRGQLAEQFPVSPVQIIDKQVSTDGTRKYIVQFADGDYVETVGMPVYGADGKLDRLTVCVSSQVGCPMGCIFCATGKEGFKRNLTALEIRDQVLAVQKDFGARVTNVVVMGQGEPFLNYPELNQALHVINGAEDINIASRHITVSTCGILKGVHKFADEPEQITLAISLHSAIQETRDRLMPGVKNQPLDQLKRELIRYQDQTNRRITFEYLMIKGVNDTEEQLQALIKFCKGLLCHVNLLPMNSIDGSPLQPSSDPTVKHWIAALEKAGIEATRRMPRGSDIAGACGQLKNSFKK